MTKKKPQLRPKGLKAKTKAADPMGGGTVVDIDHDWTFTVVSACAPMVAEELDYLTGEPNHAQGFLALVRCKGDGTVLTAFAEQSGDAAVAELIGLWHYGDETCAQINQVPDFRTLRVFRIGNPPPAVAA